LREKRRRILLVESVSFHQLALRGLEGYAIIETTTFESGMPGVNFVDLV
jgi:hypothetical protein